MADCHLGEPRRLGVGNGGLKALGMDHGNPGVVGQTLLYCADEHIIFTPGEAGSLPEVGDAIRVIPSHVDPTVAYHERMFVVRDETVIDSWPVDLRNW